MEPRPRLIRQELQGLQAYLERLVLLARDLPPRPRQDFLQLLDEHTQGLTQQLHGEHPLKLPTTVVGWGAFLGELFVLLEWHLKWRENPSTTYWQKLVNALYLWGHQLHQLLDPGHQLQIQLPRPHLAQWRPQSSPIPCFHWGPDQDLHGGHPRGQVLDLAQATEEKVQEWVRLCFYEMHHRRLPQAIQWLERALHRRPSARLYTLRGWLAALQEDPALAKALCLKAIERDPTHADAYNDYGTYLMNDGHYEQALSWFEKAQGLEGSLFPEYPLINAGKVYLHLGQRERALWCFERALSYIPYQKELGRLVGQLKGPKELHHGPSAR